MKNADGVRMRFLKIPCLLGMLILPSLMWADATYCDLKGVAVNNVNNPNMPKGAPEPLKNIIKPSFPWPQVGKYAGGATGDKYDGQKCVQATATDLYTTMTFTNNQNFPIQIGCQGIRVYDPANSPPIDPSLAPVGACYTINSKGTPVTNATVTVQPQDEVVFYAVSGVLKLSHVVEHNHNLEAPNPLQWYQAVSGVSITVSMGEHLISLPFIFQMRNIFVKHSKANAILGNGCFFTKDAAIYCELLLQDNQMMPAVFVNASDFHGLNYDKTGLSMSQTFSDASGTIIGAAKPPAGFSASGAYQNYVSCGSYTNDNYPEGSVSPDSATEADLQLIYLGALSNSDEIEVASNFDLTTLDCKIEAAANP